MNYLLSACACLIRCALAHAWAALLALWVSVAGYGSLPTGRKRNDARYGSRPIVRSVRYLPA